MSPAWHPSGDKLIYSKFVAAGGGTQGAQSDPQNFTITVSPVNDAPVATIRSKAPTCSQAVQRSGSPSTQLHGSPVCVERTEQSCSEQ